MNQDGQLEGYSPQKVNILLTFDDGFIDNYTVVAPILTKFNMSAIFFLITDFMPVGTPPNFITQTANEYNNLTAYKTIKTVQAS